jgi:hypothetical protein
MKRTSGRLAIALLLILAIPFLMGAHGESKSKSSKKSKPVYITDQPISVVDVSPRQPFQKQEIASGSDAAFVEFIDEVPVGVRLVMQHVSLSGSLYTEIPTDATYSECSLFVNGLVETRLKLDVAVERRGDDEYIAEGPITFYADAGDSVRARCRGFDANFDPTSGITLVGTLVGEFVPVGD